SATCGLVAAFVITAREGPDQGLPLLEEPRRRLLAADAGAPQWTALAENAAAALALLTGDPAATLDHAERVADILGRDHWIYAASHAALYAMTAARAIGNTSSLDRWVRLAMTDKSKRRSPNARARRAFARAERSVAGDDCDAAIMALG